jgi:hypothetical protein
LVHDLLSPLFAERSRLETELRQVPVFRQLEAVNSAIAAIKSAYEESEPPALIAQPSEMHASRRQPGSTTSRVVQVAVETMQSTNRRYKSSEVLELARKAGVEVSGTKPHSVVASILSHDDRFDNRYDHRGNGYGLREWVVTDNFSHVTAIATKENEPSSGHAVGSDTADEGAPPPNSASDHSNSPARGSCV